MIRTHFRGHPISLFRAPQHAFWIKMALNRSVDDEPNSYEGTIFSSKPTLFQIMAEIDIVPNFFDWHDKVKTKIPDVFGNLRGQLGTSMSLAELRKNGVYNTTIGSITFKFDFHDKRIAVLLFKNGKLKISGGFPAKLLIMHDKRAYNDFLSTCVKEIKEVIGYDSSDNEYTLTCLNGQFIHPRFENMAYLEKFIGKMKCSFAKIKRPDNDAPGRRGAFKLYLHKDRKTHVAMCCKGNAQVFACRSFDELFHVFSVFKVDLLHSLQQTVLFYQLSAI